MKQLWAVMHRLVLFSIIHLDNKKDTISLLTHAESVQERNEPREN
jgi:hypothetical protein